jgi:hypothetical protein
MKLDAQFDRDIIIYAFRYALTRNSYAPSLMRAKLDEVWSQLENWDKEQIIDEASSVSGEGWKEWASKKRREESENADDT